MFMHGIKASALIQILKDKIAQHGDLEVYSGGGDYPEGVQDVAYEARGNAYVPKNSFHI